MRILIDEGALGLIGAFCIAAFTLGAAWSLLEGLFGLGGFAAGLLSIVATAGTLEWISRRQYREAPGEARPTSRPEAPRARLTVVPGGATGRAATAAESEPARLRRSA